MRKFWILILSLLTLLNTCTKNDHSLNNDNDSVFYEVHNRDSYSKNNSGKKLEIDLHYYQLNSDDKIATRINQAITYNIFSKFGLENISDTTSFPSYFKAVKQEYDKMQQSLPNATSIGFQQKTISKVSCNTDDMLSVYINTYVYSGGAHGMEYREFLNFDTKSGQQIDILSTVENKGLFVMMAEQKLREILKMSPDDQWSEHTFLQNFKLPKNIGMTKDGYKLIYNPYELLPYSEGHTEIFIGFDEL